VSEQSAPTPPAATPPAAPALPASLAAAWGLRERPTKGPKRSLSLERIVEAAVRVAAEEGLPAVSIGRVAKELGSSPMSLYRYFATKDELLALMVDAAYGRPVPPPAVVDGAAEGWRAGLARWATSARARLHANPWALSIPVSGPPMTPNQMYWLEDGLVSLRGTGLAEQEKLSVILLISGYVRNDAKLAADMGAGIAAAVAAGATVQEALDSYGATLALLIDPQRLPNVHAAITAGALSDDDALEGEFTFGLDRILDGVEVLIRQRSA